MVEHGHGDAAGSQPPPATPVSAPARAPAPYPSVVRIAGDDGSTSPATQPDANADAPRVAIYDHGSGRSAASFPDSPAAAPTPTPAPASAPPATQLQPAPAAASSAAKPQPGNVSNAAHVVAAMRAGFRACYQAGLVENRDMAGSIRVTIRVGANGSVTDAQGNAQGLSPSVVECVLSRAREGKFDPPEGRSAVIAVPVTFVKK
jgi:outer membrane biosynthesis protein TonB